jgi:hypothetical protein
MMTGADKKQLAFDVTVRDMAWPNRPDRSCKQVPGYLCKYLPPECIGNRTGMLESRACPGGETGRHPRLKISCQKWRTGSIPVPGTISKYQDVRRRPTSTPPSYDNRP